MQSPLGEVYVPTLRVPPPLLLSITQNLRIVLVDFSAGLNFFFFSLLVKPSRSISTAAPRGNFDEPDDRQAYLYVKKPRYYALLFGFCL